MEDVAASVVVKELNKRKSGEAFHLILKEPGQNGEGLPELSSLKATKHLTPRKEISLEDIQQKIESAERRRLAKQQEILEAAKDKEEKLLQAKIRRNKANNKFQSQAEENLKIKLSKSQAMRDEQILQKKEKLKEMDERAQQVRKEKERKKDEGQQEQDK